jgi:hypothetical protein
MISTKFQRTFDGAGKKRYTEQNRNKIAAARTLIAA